MLKAGNHCQAGFQQLALVKIFVPKMYPSFGNGAIFAFVATNEINNLRVINTP
jgi:hypothetical protein